MRSNSNSNSSMDKNNRERIKIKKECIGMNIGYSLLDIDISNNNENIIYSTWSNSIYLYSILNEKQYSLKLKDLNEPFGVFSIQFNNLNENEILTGTSKGIIYLFDINKNKSIFEIKGHDIDINSIKYLNENVFLSSSDDATIKVWDKRLNSSIGYFLGHTSGIYLIF